MKLLVSCCYVTQIAQNYAAFAAYSVTQKARIGYALSLFFGLFVQSAFGGEVGQLVGDVNLMERVHSGCVVLLCKFFFQQADALL